MPKKTDTTTKAIIFCVERIQYEKSDKSKQAISDILNILSTLNINVILLRPIVNIIVTINAILLTQKTTESL